MKITLEEHEAVQIVPINYPKIGDPITFVRDTLPQEELLCQLAEECNELAKAELKLRRTYSNLNPTPIKRRERGGDPYGVGQISKNALQKRWAAIRAFGKVEFENFSDFLAWCEESGYESGAKLMRRDSEKPFSRENCYWSSDYISETYAKERAIRAAEWERGVGPIREMLRPEIDTQLRRQEQEKEIEIQINGRQVWCYEHPDLVREGIVFESSRSV